MNIENNLYEIDIKNSGSYKKNCRAFLNDMATVTYGNICIVSW